MTVALPPPEDRSFADVWSALGGELKPSLDVVVSAPVDTGQQYRPGRRSPCRRVGPRRAAPTAGRPREQAAAHRRGRGPADRGSQPVAGRAGAAVTGRVTGAGLAYLLAPGRLVEERIRRAGRTAAPTTRRRTTRSAACT